MVPPTSNSTGMPGLVGKARPLTFSTVSFQLPPHTLTTSEFWAQAAGATAITASKEATITATKRARLLALLMWVSVRGSGRVDWPPRWGRPPRWPRRWGGGGGIGGGGPRAPHRPGAAAGS